MGWFETRFLPEAVQFIDNLDPASREKVLYNIDLAQQVKDPRLFKKIQDDIWEFRTRYLRRQIRLLAFWDREEEGQTLVIATHGFIKKVDKIPGREVS